MSGAGGGQSGGRSAADAPRKPSLKPDQKLGPTKPLAGLLARLRKSGPVRIVQAGAPAEGTAETMARGPAGRTSPQPIETSAISGVVFDSRQVLPGSLFVAVPGDHADGHDFLVQASGSGAAVAVVAHPVEAPLTQLVVPDTRLALAVAAAWWFGDPSLELGIVGVTGTDGKTTTSFLATALLEAAGISTGLITTAAVKVGRELAANQEHVTTPQAPELQGTLRNMVRAGNEAAVVETTSHGLALRRVAEIAYDVAVFTNLTHEHLELHRTFEAYREAKASLFSGLGRGRGGMPVAKSLGRPWPKAAVINVDDPSAPFFVEAARSAGARVITYGWAASPAQPAVTVPNAETGAGSTVAPDVTASDISEDKSGLSFVAITPRWRARVALRLAGRFNVSNALAAIALGEALEIDPAAIRRGLAGLPGVPGRMERIDLGQPFGVVVDYAHSPAALEKVLDILAPIAGPGGGLVAVFGSAGERDVGKRAAMGRIAGERCRLVVVTDEDPRGEDRLAIIDEIATGAESAGKAPGREVLRIPDRRAAIAEAFSRAKPGDVVLLAGKGHEQSIIMADGPIPWDEKAEAVEALGRLGFTGGPRERDRDAERGADRNRRIGIGKAHRGDRD